VTKRSITRTTKNAAKKSNQPDQKAARDKYINDFMQCMKTNADRQSRLRADAPTRIRAAISATKAAGLTNSASDDSLAHYHVVQRFLQEKAFYPPHDKRKESNAYAKIHKQIVILEDQPCLVCRVKHSTLGDLSKNPFGAVQLETHHHIIEWALGNAIVPELFNAHIRPGLLRRARQRSAQGVTDPIFQEFDALYSTPMSAVQIKAWVDHSPDNLWVLCDVHHRHKFVGIHAITYPIWGPQDLVDARIVNKEIGLAHGKR